MNNPFQNLPLSITHKLTGLLDSNPAQSSAGFDQSFNKPGFDTRLSNIGKSVAQIGGPVPIEPGHAFNAQQRQVFASGGLPIGNIAVDPFMGSIEKSVGKDIIRETATGIQKATRAAGKYIGSSSELSDKVRFLHPDDKTLMKSFVDWVGSIPSKKFEQIPGHIKDGAITLAEHFGIPTRGVTFPTISKGFGKIINSHDNYITNQNAGFEASSIGKRVVDKTVDKLKDLYK